MSDCLHDRLVHCNVDGQLVPQNDGNLVLHDPWHPPLRNSMRFPVLRVH